MSLTNSLKFFEYYPFGMQEPSRTYSAGNQYRYGFNGKEKDNESAFNQYDYGDRIYDSRLGKFISIDTKSSKYPGISGYSFALNNPLYFVDPDGKDIIGLMELLFRKNFPSNFNLLNQLTANVVWKKLTENFAKGGMYDKLKIDLEFSNYSTKELKHPEIQGAVQSKQGAFQPKNNEIPYGETGLYVKLSNGKSVDILDIVSSPYFRTTQN